MILSNILPISVNPSYIRNSIQKREMKVLSTHPLADTALRFDSRIRKPLIDNLDMTIRQWRDVSDDVKNQMWNKLITRFVLPRGSEELVKNTR